MRRTAFRFEVVRRVFRAYLDGEWVRPSPVECTVTASRARLRGDLAGIGTGRSTGGGRHGSRG